ncbi:hypothetical protein BH10PLA1_BH10PLA1_02830 [soil metagenome]
MRFTKLVLRTYRTGSRLPPTGTLTIVLVSITLFAFSRSSSAAQMSPPASQGVVLQSTGSIAIAYDSPANARFRASLASSAGPNPVHAAAKASPNWASLLAVQSYHPSVPVGSATNTRFATSPSPSPSSLNLLAVGLAFLALTRKLKLAGR